MGWDGSEPKELSLVELSCESRPSRAGGIDLDPCDEGLGSTDKHDGGSIANLLGGVF
jgi:hypothetical protein